MLLVRNVLEIDPERMKAVRDSAHRIAPILKSLNIPTTRIMTDLVGGFYTLVIETEVPDLATFETGLASSFAHPEWQKFYSDIRGAVRGGRREIFTIVG